LGEVDPRHSVLSREEADERLFFDVAESDERRSQGTPRSIRLVERAPKLFSRQERETHEPCSKVTRTCRHQEREYRGGGRSTVRPTGDDSPIAYA
jgi:hypothetical protein